MGYLFAPAGSGVTGSAAETLTGSWVAMAAGIAPDIARKVRRERDVPGENGYFILIQDRRRWFFLGNAERILICQHASQSQAARAAGFSPREYPGLPLAIRSGDTKLSGNSCGGHCPNRIVQLLAGKLLFTHEHSYLPCSQLTSHQRLKRSF